MNKEETKETMEPKDPLSAIFLSEGEVAELTGYKQALKQVATLQLQGIPFKKKAAGKPKISLDISAIPSVHPLYAIVRRHKVMDG